MTLYERLKAAGCDINNHESDLHFRASEEALAILKAFTAECIAAGGLPPMASWFVSDIDGARWVEVPLAFDPFWQARGPRP